MSEIINISENIKENLEKKKEKYPNLRDFYYDENSDTLTYNGETICPASYALSHTAQVFFQMVPQDIFDYLKNGFYYQSSAELEKINDMLKKELVITEEEQNQLKTFVKQYIKRLEIYMNNKLLFDQGLNDLDLNAFINNLLARKGIIESVNNNTYYSVAASIIKNEYDSIINQINTKNSEQVNDLENEMTRQMTLTRKPPKSVSYIFPEQEDVDKEIEKNQHLGMAGFTSIILIIATVVTVGMYLAAKLL